MRQILGHLGAFGLPIIAAIFTNETFADRMYGGQGMGTALSVVFGFFATILSCVIAAIMIVVHGAPQTAIYRQHLGRTAFAFLGMAGVAVAGLLLMDMSGATLSYAEEEPAFLAATLAGLGCIWFFYLFAISRRGRTLSE